MHTSGSLTPCRLCAACCRPSAPKAKYMASQYVGARISGLCLQDDVLVTIHDWLADPATAHNTTVLLVAGLIFTNEEDYVEALKALHGGESLEM